MALDADSAVIVTIGSKEGISHLCLALVGPGDTVMVPAPAFPIHVYAAFIAGANVIRVALDSEEIFLRLAIVENENRINQALKQMRLALRELDGEIETD